MSLATYSDLKGAVAAWLHREDLTASIPDFVSLAESRIGRDLRMLRQLTVASLPLVAGTATAALPVDWLGFRSLRLLAPDTELELLPAARFVARYTAAERGSPRFYVIEGQSLRLGPTPDANGSISATYFARVPALTALAETGWLLTEHPGLYLFGALAEAAPFLGQADNRVALWESKYRSAVAEAHKADAAAASSGSVLRVRAR